MEQKLGFAEWAHPDDLSDRYPYEDGSFWLGRSLFDGTPIGTADDGHIALTGRTRSGKGTTAIINNLLLWPGSVIVVDPKGENATVTASRRGDGSDYCEGMGQNVYVLDPFGASSVDQKYRASLNPLDAVHRTDTIAIEQAADIAHALIVPESKNDPNWENVARDMLGALILHVVSHPRFEGRRTLNTVRKLGRGGDLEAYKALKDAGEEKIPTPMELLWESVARNTAYGGELEQQGESIAGILSKAPKQFFGYARPLFDALSFLSTNEMQECVGRSDFNISDIKSDPDGVSVYLCLPENRMERNFRWIRLMLTILTHAIESAPGKTGANGHRILAFLDEFHLLKNVPAIERAASYGAGSGLKLAMVLHSYEILKSLYPDRWETMLGNCTTKIIFSVGDNFTKKYISDHIGDTDIVRLSQNQNESDTTNKSNQMSNTVSDAQGTSEQSTQTTGDSVADGRTSSRAIGNVHTTTEGGSIADTENQQIAKGQSRSKQIGWSKQQSEQSNWSNSTNRQESRGSSDAQGYSPSSMLFRSTEKTMHLFRENENRTLASNHGIALGNSKNRGGGRGKSVGRSGSDGITDSVTHSDSVGKTRTEQHSQSHAASQTDTLAKSRVVTKQSSQSQAVGTTNTHTISQTKGETHGSSHTKGGGTSETFHRRPLLPPDMVGRLFDMPEDRSPGWALVLIGNKKPAIVQRTLYYEDRWFAWLFDPHPDFDAPPKILGSVALEAPPLDGVLSSSEVYIEWIANEDDELIVGNSIASVTLPGPARLFDAQALSHAEEIPALPGFDLLTDEATIRIEALFDGVLDKRLVTASSTINDVDELALFNVNRRKHMMQTELVPFTPVDRYISWLEDLKMKETEGQHAYELLQQRQQDEADAAERARIEAQRLEEQDRFRQERLEKEQRESVLDKATQEAIDWMMPCHNWSDDDRCALLVGSTMLCANFAAALTPGYHIIAVAIVTTVTTVLAVLWAYEEMDLAIIGRNSKKGLSRWSEIGNIEKEKRIDTEIDIMLNRLADHRDDYTSTNELIFVLATIFVGLFGLVVGMLIFLESVDVPHPQDLNSTMLRNLIPMALIVCASAATTGWACVLVHQHRIAYLTAKWNRLHTLNDDDVLAEIKSRRHELFKRISRTRFLEKYNPLFFVYFVLVAAVAALVTVDTSVTWWMGIALCFAWFYMTIFAIPVIRTILVIPKKISWFFQYAEWPKP